MARKKKMIAVLLPEDMYFLIMDVLTVDYFYDEEIRAVARFMSAQYPTGKDKQN